MLRNHHRRRPARTSRTPRAFVAALGLGTALGAASWGWAAQNADAQSPSEAGARAEQQAPQRGADTHVGVLLESNERQLTISQKGTKTHTHKVAPGVRVTLDGREARIEDLKKGDLVQVETSGEDPSLAVAVQAKRADQGPVGSQGARRVAQREPLAQQRARPPEQAADDRPREAQRDGRDRREPRAAEREGASPQADSNHAWMGVVLRASEDQEGITLERVYPNGPASRAGLRSGDTVLEIGDRPIASVDQFVEVVGRKRPGEMLKVTVLRNDNRRDLEVRLASRDDFFGSYELQEARRQGDPEEDRAFEEGDDSDSDGLLLFEHDEENHRELCQQHQRLEAMILELQQQIGTLRQEIQTLSQNK